jgi:tetratricopeptide (TPR) repeat protein
MRIHSFLSIFLFAGLLSACGGDPSRPMADGDRAVHDPLASAFDSINALIVASPGKADLYGGRAQLFLGLDSLGPAQRDLERAVRLDSMDVGLRLRLGDLYYRTTQVAKAQAQFERAAQLDPGNTQALLKQAEIQLVLRNYAKSMTLVNDALEQDKHAAHGYFLKGWIHMETGDTALALSSFRTAVEQDAEDYPTYIMLGKLSAARHDPLAEQYYSTAISLRPRSVEAWYDKGMYYQENRQDSLALDCYAQIMRIDSTNALAWYNTGYVRLEHLHDPQRAKQDFSKAIQLVPGYVDAWYNRGLAMERIDELDSAAANYEIVMSMRPDHALAAAGLDRLQAQGVRIKIREKHGQ